MKKIPFFFLLSLIIFAVFIIISLSKSNSIPTTNSESNSNSSICLVTINGQKYDVTQYRYQHQGGEVFTCGTDMSTTFAKQHPQRYLNKIKVYLVP